MKVVQSAPHEYEAHYLFDGLGLWFAADRLTSDMGGSLRGSFDRNGETWNVTLSYQESGLAPPEGGETPGGTEVEHDTIREYRLNAVVDDEIGEKKVKCHIAPRWYGLQSESGKDAARPLWEAGDATNVRINAANVEPEAVQQLIEKSAKSVRINGQHVTESNRRDDYSNVTDAARYVRLDKNVSGPIHAREGPIARLSHLLESDRTGYRKVVQDDTKRAGHYHTVTLGPMRTRQAWADHSIPREVKHYYGLSPDSLPNDHPLAHPKLEVSYQRSRWDETLRIDDHQQIKDELHEAIISVLESAGLPTSPEVDGGDGVFVPDEYFDAETTQISGFPELHLSRIESDQRNVVVRQLADGLSPVEWGSVETLVSDGGQVSPADIADEHGFHPDSVTKALRRISDMVDREYGSVALRSHYVAEQVAEAVREAKESVSAAVETASNAMDRADRERLSERTDELIAFCNRHGIHVDEREAEIRVRMGDITGMEWDELLTSLKDLWTAAGRDVSRLKEATTHYRQSGTPYIRPARSVIKAAE